MGRAAVGGEHQLLLSLLHCAGGRILNKILSQAYQEIAVVGNICSQYHSDCQKGSPWEATVTKQTLLSKVW